MVGYMWRQHMVSTQCQSHILVMHLSFCLVTAKCQLGTLVMRKCRPVSEPLSDVCSEMMCYNDSFFCDVHVVLGRVMS